MALRPLESKWAKDSQNQNKKAKRLITARLNHLVLALALVGAGAVPIISCGIILRKFAELYPADWNVGGMFIFMCGELILTKL